MKLAKQKNPLLTEQLQNLVDYVLEMNGIDPKTKVLKAPAAKEVEEFAGEGADAEVEDLSDEGKDDKEEEKMEEEKGDEEKDDKESDDGFEIVGWTKCMCGKCTFCLDGDTVSEDLTEVPEAPEVKKGRASSEEAMRAPAADPKKGAQRSREISDSPPTKRSRWIANGKKKKTAASSSTVELTGSGPAVPVEVPEEGETGILTQKLRPPFEFGNRNPKEGRAGESYLMQAPGPTKRYMHHVHSQLSTVTSAINLAF